MQNKLKDPKTVRRHTIYLNSNLFNKEEEILYKKKIAIYCCKIPYRKPLLNCSTGQKYKSFSTF